MGKNASRLSLDAMMTVLVYEGPFEPDYPLGFG